MIFCSETDVLWKVAFVGMRQDDLSLLYVYSFQGDAAVRKCLAASACWCDVLVQINKEFLLRWELLLSMGNINVLDKNIIIDDSSNHRSEIKLNKN